jgi:hypothetical protein
MPIHENGVDSLALERFVLHEVDSTLRTRFAEALIASVLAERGLQAPPNNSSAYRLLRERIAAADLPLTGNRAADAVVRELESIRATGLIRSRVEEYATKEEIDPRRLTDRVKDAMVQYLLDLGVQLDDDQKFDQGSYDEYLALAYANAIRTTGGAADPIVAARLKTGAEPWDFRVRFYDDVESAAVVPDYIRVAGAIDYAFHVGEVLRVFELADHVVGLWDGGALDIEEQETIDRLFTYAENASSRPTPERRGLLYKRVLSLGPTAVTGSIVANDGFPKLWHRLMTEAVKYIELRQEHESEHISRRPIVHAIRDLQYNLTEFAGGGTSRAAQKLNAQLEDAMDIVGAPEVVEQLSRGRRKSVWRVIQALAKEVGGAAVNVLAVRTLAEEGNRIFNFIADYSPSTAEDDFDAFLESAEAWILAEAAVLERDDTAAEDQPAPTDLLEEHENGAAPADDTAAADDWD